MTVKGQVVYNRVNLVRFVRRLDKSVNEVDWGTGRSWTQWLKSESAIGGSLVLRDAYPRVAIKLNLWLVAIEARPKIARKRGARQ